jgi:xylulokinase
MSFDVTQRTWSPTMLGLAGLDVALFPAIRESGAPLGRVTQQAAVETGLAEGTPVMVGGHDHLCGALGSGVFEPGPVLDSVGTSEVVLMTTERFSTPGQDPEKQGFSCGCHVVPGRYYAYGGIRSAGAMVEWLRTTFEKDLLASGQDPYAAMADAGLSSPRGAKGLFVLPFVAGGRPHRDPEARGVMFGLRTSHSTADIIRASFEGLGYELRRAIGALEAFTGAPVSRLRAIGGGARNELWLRVKANITGKPIDILGMTESAALGAALLAGLGTGVYADPSTAVRQVYRIDRTIEPDAAAYETYSKWYEEIYLQLYPQLRGAFLAASSLFPDA